MGYEDKELSILFTDDDYIAQLNSKYLGKKGPTNVLAFPMEDVDEEFFPMLGDIVISIDTALRESKELGEKPLTTIKRLLIHGLLHLLGYDHEGSLSEAEVMEREEKRLLVLLEED